MNGWLQSEPVTVSALEHYCYCARQCALIHVDGVWFDNEHTVRGQRGHARADEPGARLERGRKVVRAVPIWSERYGLSGRADAIEIWPDGSVVPVEYKMGYRHGDAAHVQLCAQALCLEEMLAIPVDRGAIWFAGPRRRVDVSIDGVLRARTVEVIAAVHQLRRDERLPPAPADRRCDQCQLLAYCMPTLVHDPEVVTGYVEQEVLRCDC